METKGFDEVILRSSEEGGGSIGYLAGSATVLFIKTGQGGTIDGYEGRYVTLAHKMHAQFGCTVFVSETTSDLPNAFQWDMRFVESRMQDAAYRICYMGVSKGGLIGCWYAGSDSHVERVACVNAPLMINFHNKTLPAIKELSGRLTMYCGSRDPSYIYVPHAERYATVKVIEGGDHTLRGRDDLFERIAQALLENRNEE